MLMGRTSCLLVRLLCVINCYLNVIVRLFPCNENKCYLRDEDNCCSSWTWVHFRCSSGTILFFSYAALAPKFEFEWECQRGDLNFNGAWAAASASWADGTVLPAQPSHQPSHLLAIRTGPKLVGVEGLLSPAPLTHAGSIPLFGNVESPCTSVATHRHN